MSTTRFGGEGDDAAGAGGAAAIVGTSSADSAADANRSYQCRQTTLAAGPQQDAPSMPAVFFDRLSTVRTVFLPLNNISYNENDANAVISDDDDDDEKLAGSPRALVVFSGEVTAFLIPQRSDYSIELADALYYSMKELSVLVARNILEFSFEGYDSSKVVEDDEMVVDDHGERIHPVHMIESVWSGGRQAPPPSLDHDAVPNNLLAPPQNLPKPIPQRPCLPPGQGLLDHLPRPIPQRPIHPSLWCVRNINDSKIQNYYHHHRNLHHDIQDEIDEFHRHQFYNYNHSNTFDDIAALPNPPSRDYTILYC